MILLMYSIQESSLTELYLIPMSGSPNESYLVAEGYLIAGFDEGILYMKEGGKARFLIPSSLAYGPGGYYTIPGYTPLLFDVELVKVAPGPSK